LIERLMEIQANAYNKVIDKDYNELKQLIEKNMESLELKELI